jgi:hypothetical protein
MFFPVQVQLKLALVVYVAYIGWYIITDCSNEKTYLL